MNEEIEYLKEQFSLLERQIREIGGKAENNSSYIEEVINKMDRTHEDLNEKLSTVTNDVSEIKSELSDVQKNVENLIDKVENINEFIENDVRGEIESLKDFNEEIIA